MKRFLLPLIASLALPLQLGVKAVHADFGKADIQEETYTTKEFDAWCGKKGNDCKVVFTDRGISVDESLPVSYERIKDFSFDENHGWGCQQIDGRAMFCPGKKYSFDIYYIKSSGEEGTARFIFMHHKTALSFLGAIKNSKGKQFNRSDPRCEKRNQTYYNGRCIDKGLARVEKEQRMIEGFEKVGEAIDKEREFNLKERELDIKEYDAMTPDVIQNNQLNIQQNQQNLQQNNFF